MPIQLGVETVQLTEDLAKSFLQQQGLPIPRGAVCATPEEAIGTAQDLGGRVAVKALVPTGRRGKAGAVRLVDDAGAAGHAAAEMLGSQVAGFTVERVYLEEFCAISEELYLSFLFDGAMPRAVLSKRGGVDIESVHAESPGAVVTEDIDPVKGLRVWEAIALWERAGVSAEVLQRLGQLTCQLWVAFRALDALMVEINPLARVDDRLVLVGAMLELDDNALYRQSRVQSALNDETMLPANPRERYVVEADRRYRGGAIRYTELEGDIGLLVAGGGAGLLQHDLIVDAGGRPANHSDVSPGPTPDKVRSLIEAVFDNPQARGLLIGYNYLQMAPCDLVVQGLLEAVESRSVDLRRFPVVLRLFGPKEEEARALAARVHGLHYMQHGASLEEGVNQIVELTRRASGTGVSS